MIKPRTCTQPQRPWYPEAVQSNCRGRPPARTGCILSLLKLKAIAIYECQLELWRYSGNPGCKTASNKPSPKITANQFTTRIVPKRTLRDIYPDISIRFGQQYNHCRPRLQKITIPIRRAYFEAITPARREVPAIVPGSYFNCALHIIEHYFAVQLSRSHASIDALVRMIQFSP